MKARRGLLLAGSLWELVRFFLVLFLLAAVLHDLAGAGAWVFPWLLVAGSGNLLIAAGIGMVALFPGRYGRLVALLRLGKVLGIFSFILLAVSGGLRPAAGLELAQAGAAPVRGSMVLVFVGVMDVLLLAVLLFWRSAEEPRAAAAGTGGGAGAGGSGAGGPGDEDKLPEYDETEVKNFH